VGLVEEYADPYIGGALGLHGEAMILEGFARKQFVMHGRNTRTFGDREWTYSEHDLDFIFERDGVAYGIEVKNTLGYMDYRELQIKIALCQEIGVRSVFAARMLPRTWINEIIGAGGFAVDPEVPVVSVDSSRSSEEGAGSPRVASGLSAGPRGWDDGTIRAMARGERVIS